MTAYAIDPARSNVVVCARSSIHDTNTTWSRVTGTIDADPAALEGAAASIAVDMRAFDAGDFLRNRKLKKDLDVDRYPEAAFTLTGLRDVVDKGGNVFAATAEGTLRWREREVTVRAAGEGRVDAERVEATARFELDVRDLGIKPPKFLMLKVEEVVAVEVTITATR